jgi:hypothetical protein
MVGFRLAPFPDTDRHGLGGLELSGLAPVGRTGPQVVEVARRDVRQALELRLAELLKLALEDAPGGRPTQALMGLVDLRQ